MTRLTMLKGQLSGVSWPGNSWMPFTFQAALLVFQQPHKHSHSLQLAIHTNLPHYCIQYALWGLLPFFPTFLQSTVQPQQSTKITLERAASHIKVTCICPPCLFRLPTWENVNRSTTLINSMRVMSSNKLFLSLELPTLTRKLARMLKLQLG